MISPCDKSSRVCGPYPYWQAKEISRGVRQADPAGNGSELALLRHVSPIEGENVVVYGEYRLDRRRIRTGRVHP